MKTQFTEFEEVIVLEWNLGKIINKIESVYTGDNKAELLESLNKSHSMISDHKISIGSIINDAMSKKVSV